MPSSASPPVLRYWAALRAEFSGLVSWGICNPNSTLSDGSPSQHAYCNAIDVHHASVSVMQQVANWTYYWRDQYAVQYLIWNRQVSSAQQRGWHPYGGVHPHDDHVHVDFLPAYGGPLPGVPVGQASPSIKFYPDPPVLRPPYNSHWRWQAAIMLWAHLGGDPPPPTVSDEAIEEAVRRFRAARSLADNDSVNVAVWNRLGSVVIREGFTGRYVTALQALLAMRGLGFFLATETGRFGDQTLEAVLELQRQATLQRDGIVGAQSWRALWWGPAEWPARGTQDDKLIGKAATLPAGGELAESWAPHVRAAFERVGDTVAALADASRALRRL